MSSTLKREQTARSESQSSGRNENLTSMSSSDALTEGFSTDEYGNTYPEGGLQAWSSCLGSFCSMLVAFNVICLEYGASDST